MEKLKSCAEMYAAHVTAYDPVHEKAIFRKAYATISEIVMASLTQVPEEKLKSSERKARMVGQFRKIDKESSILGDIRALMHPKLLAAASNVCKTAA